VISGEVQIGTEILKDRDALCIEEIDSFIDIKSTQKSRILVIEIPE
jgi:hypothetical protein